LLVVGVSVYWEPRGAACMVVGLVVCGEGWTASGCQGL